MATIAKEVAAKVNYTNEQEARMREAYEAAPSADTVATLATEFGKSTKSIIAKLSRMGIYKAKERTRKDGSAVQKKDEFADAIGAVLGLSEPDVESLTKANRKALEAIFKALAESKPL